jgi:ABC-2 type transport system ATP-binding protein
MTPMVALRVDGAVKRFAEVSALDGVSLTVRSGELLALLGPNGAGKTTLVRAIAGRVRLDGGEIELLGQLLDGGPPPEGLGLVPQEVALYPLLTPSENLEAFGRYHGLAGAALRDAVASALEWTRLESRSREPVKHFSGGMKRRLNIACGVLHRPRFVLLDEPTVGVDPQSRERIYEMLASLRREGASLLLTTHQLEEAEARCDRVVIVDHGRTVADGTVAELVDRSFGSSHTVSLTLGRPPASPLPGLTESGSGRQFSATIHDVALGLPALLAELHTAGATVEGVTVRRPGLAGVFLALTGRELRE